MTQCLWLRKIFTISITWYNKWYFPGLHVPYISLHMSYYFTLRIIVIFFFLFFRIQQRHRSDSQVNNRSSFVLRGGQLVEERWFKVQVGDIIRMENDQFVAVSPCFYFFFFVPSQTLGYLISIILNELAPNLATSYRNPWRANWMIGLHNSNQLQC